MRKVYEYSHLGGLEILRVRYPHIENEINNIISSVKVPSKTKVSKEKTKKGQLLYSPKELNRRFKEEFRKRGYKELKDPYTISVKSEKYKVEIKGVFKQIDYVKERILVEVQFGKYAFMFYDVAKFQYFFNESQAEVGVEIVPCYALKNQMSTGVSYGEQLIWDIERLRRHFPSVPIKVILIDVD